MTTPSTVRICGQHALTLALGISLALPSAGLAALPPLRVAPAMRAASANGAIVAGAAVQAPGDPKVSVEILVALDGTDDSIIAGRLAGASRDALKDEAVELVADGEGSVVRVRVRWTAADAHEIALEVVGEDGERQVVPGSPFACGDCRENQLLAKVAELVVQAVGLLVEVEGEPAGAGEGGGATGESGSEGDGGDGGGAEGVGGADGGEREGLGGLGKAGIGVSLLGLGALVGGGVLVSMGKNSERTGADPSAIDDTDFRPPGLAVIAAGGVVLLAGVGMLIGDLRSPKRKRRTKRVSVTPTLAPRFGGFSMSGRF